MAEPRHVDLLVTNAAIATMNPSQPIATAMAVDDDRIVAVGDSALLQDFTARRSVDLRGGFVMPGFIDTHTHLRGDAPWHLDLTSVRSVAEIRALIAARAAKLPTGHWITGYGWSEDELGEGRRPLRDDLDDAAPGNPVGLTRAGGHSAVFNSTALAMARINEDSPQPESGVIERGDDGRLNGIIRERHDLVLDYAPKASDALVRDSLINNLRALFRLGITSIVQAADSIDHYAEWQHIYRLHGGTLPRASIQVAWEGNERMHASGLITGQGDKHLRVGAIKIFADGGFTGPAAYTTKPYKGMGDYRGALTMAPGTLYSTLEAAHVAGWQIGIHAIGDAAIELVVDTLAQILETHPRTNHRHYLNHFTIKPDDTTMRTMAANSIAITQQPNFTYTLEGRYAAYLDAPSLASNNPLRSPLRHGIHLALSSDILPLGPLLGIRTAVTRAGMSGTVHGADERLTVDEALAGYTRQGAWLTFEERDKGMLAPGMLADFVVLGADPRRIDPLTINAIAVEQTWLGGRQVWPIPPLAQPSEAGG
ncbi:MAG: amidohydrolase [Pseudomonadales bacterium]